MKPYSAILLDSFVEAISSRVLWVLLVGWTLVLIALVPFHFIQDASFQFSSDEVLNQNALISKLQAACDGRGTEAQNAIVRAISPESREVLKKGQTADKSLSSGKLAAMMNEAVKADELYSQEIWPKADRRSELKDLIAIPKEQRTTDDKEHLHRRLIEQSFSGLFQPVNESRIALGYASFRLWDSPIPMTLRQMRDIVEALVFTTFLKIGLGVIAIGVAVIVTSGMIPDMFQVGSLHLMLSKPISRSLFFLTKFLGGGVFVLINIAYLLTGFYLIAGMRLGIWNQGLLLCIPVVLFVFLIFYSVSAIAGLIWKNPIVSVVVTFLFWLVCFVLGVTRGIMDPASDINPKIVEIQSLGDQLVGATFGGSLVNWNPKSQYWEPCFDTKRGGGGERKVLGPYWFADKGELLYGRANRRGPFGAFDADDIRVTLARFPEYLSPAEKATSSANTMPAENSNLSENATKMDERTTKEKGAGSKLEFGSDTRTDSFPSFPARTRRLQMANGSLFLLTDSGVYRLNREAVAKASKSSDVVANFFDKLKQANAPKSEVYQRITPDDWLPRAPMDFAIEGRHMVVYSAGRLTMWEEDEASQWTKKFELPYSDDKSQLALVGASQSNWFVVGDGAKAQIGGWGSENETVDVKGMDSVTPRKVIADPQGQHFYVATDKEIVWQVAVAGAVVQKPQMPGQGRISTLHFEANDRMLIAHGVGNVDRWNPSQGTVEKLVRPKATTFQWIYRGIIYPLYLINPKPAAVDDTISYCLMKTDSNPLKMDTSSLDNVKLSDNDPWRPIWSNSLFILVMLTIGCLYLHRQDL